MSYSIIDLDEEVIACESDRDKLFGHLTRIARKQENCELTGEWLCAIDHDDKVYIATQREILIIAVFDMVRSVTFFNISLEPNKCGAACAVFRSEGGWKVQDIGGLISVDRI